MHTSTDKAFLDRITKIVLDHLGDHAFGTAELIRISGLSRYRLSNKLHSATGQGINQFIREARLRKAFELLQDDSLTVAEVAYRTGFGSPAYFSKCFHDFYGYTPGMIRQATMEDQFERNSRSQRNKALSNRTLLFGVVAVIVISFSMIVVSRSRDRRSGASERKNIAVMPFQNLTNDPDMNIWQSAFQQNLVTSLAATGEINVIHEQSVMAHIRNSDFGGSNIQFPIANAISQRLNADYYVIGSFQKAGEQVRITASMCETRRNIVLKSFEVRGSYENGEGMFNLSDSLTDRVTQFMLISRIISKNPYYQHAFTAPKSVDALKYYHEAEKTDNPREQIRLLKKSLAADSTFYEAALSLEYAYGANGDVDSSRIWLIRNYYKRERMSDYNRLYAGWAYAFTFQSYDEQIHYLTELVQLDTEDPGNHYLLGLIYCLSGQYEEAVPELEVSLQIYKRWGDQFLSDPANFRNFKWLGIAYNNTNQLRKQKKLNKEAEKYMDHHPWLDLMKATYAFSIKDTAVANSYLKLSEDDFAEYSGSIAVVYGFTGDFFKHANMPKIAEHYYHRALGLEPNNIDLIIKYTDYCFMYNEHHDPELMDKAMKLCNNRQQYYEFLSEKGMCFLERGDYTDALKAVQEAWEEAPFKVYRISSNLEFTKRIISKEQLAGHSD